MAQRLHQEDVEEGLDPHFDDTAAGESSYLYGVAQGACIRKPIPEPFSEKSAKDIILSARDVGYLMEVLKRYSESWEEIGLSLGFSYQELSTMCRHYPSHYSSHITSRLHTVFFTPESVSCLQTLLTQWVRWPTNEHPDQPTLRALCLAIRKAGLVRLAEEVDVMMKQYKANRITGLMSVSSGPEGESSYIGLDTFKAPEKLSSESVSGSVLEYSRSAGELGSLGSEKMHEAPKELSSAAVSEKTAEDILLSEKDVTYLMGLLEGCYTLWHMIALSLGFTQLEVINMHHSYLKVVYKTYRPRGYSQNLLTQWVQWPTSEHPNQPTLKALCLALRKVGHGRLAGEVGMKMKQYRGFFKHSKPLGESSSLGLEEVHTALKDLSLGQVSEAEDIILSARDVGYLMELLKGYSDLWCTIGLSLGFTHQKVATMNHAYHDRRVHGKSTSDTAASCLRDILTQWVQWPTSMYPNRPTLIALCSALQVVGLGRLVEEVDMKMKQYKGVFKYSRPASESSFLGSEKIPMASEELSSESVSGSTFTSPAEKCILCCGEIDHNGGTLRGAGIEIQFPEGAIALGESTTVAVYASTEGPTYIEKSELHFISPVFDVECTPNVPFEKEIVLTIEHFSQFETNSDLNDAVFLVSKKGEEFHQSGEVKIQIGSSQGNVSVRHFCRFALGRKKKPKHRYSMLVALPKKCCSQYEPVSAFFSISVDHRTYKKIFQTYLKKEFHDHPFDVIVPTPVDSINDEVVLTIPEHSEGYRIQPHFRPPKILKERVDSASKKGDVYPPRIRLKIGVLSRPPRSSLMCHIPIQGIDNVESFALSANYKGVTLGGAISGHHEPDELCNTSHHAILLSQLSIHAARWRDIGTALGFKQGELNNIESKPILLRGAPGSWLSEMLSEWLEWTPGDQRGTNQRATLTGLKNALLKAGLARTAEDLTLEQQ